ncbi:chromatin associated protein KTI12 [Piedraia hortae CBS 480.64]|uniref:Chromatin associated protein KTI12 n=1 Tax=Piedraia hortae CBS 480.64 TaxID=1314780 RepID=A0A6A7BTJ0_9PEZI|nr:chromatin associated protein KTI12 [Piedraia hortae CBS 480.64]
MPLILISGFPCSGKTYRSTQLIQDLQRLAGDSYEIIHLTDSSLNITPSVYTNASTEKTARAKFTSAIQRSLGSKTIVIADTFNYIKGHRYQLYCEAKAAKTKSCVMHVACDPETARQRNEAAGLKYDVETFENLIFRYEEPDAKNRWDSPLFFVPDGDEKPPSENMWNALVGDANKVEVRPHKATVLKPQAGEGYLFELDKVTNDVVQIILEWAKCHAGEGGAVPVPGSGADSAKTVVLPALGPPSLPQLQRLRRQFIALNRQHAVDKERLKGLFVDYLNDAFE